MKGMNFRFLINLTQMKKCTVQFDLILGFSFAVVFYPECK